MATEWVTKPLTDIELKEIRMKLEDGDIRADKYAVIQRLVESGLLANQQNRTLGDVAAKYMKRFSEIYQLVRKPLEVQ